MGDLELPFILPLVGFTGWEGFPFLITIFYVLFGRYLLVEIDINIELKYIHIVIILN
jgi:hypothetical protein